MSPLTPFIRFFEDKINYRVTHMFIREDFIIICDY